MLADFFYTTTIADVELRTNTKYARETNAKQCRIQMLEIECRLATANLYVKSLQVQMFRDTVGQDEMAGFDAIALAVHALPYGTFDNLMCP